MIILKNHIYLSYLIYLLYFFLTWEDARIPSKIWIVDQLNYTCNK